MTCRLKYLIYYLMKIACDMIDKMFRTKMDATPRNLREELHTKKFHYSTDRFPFKAVLTNLLGVELEELHLGLGSFELFNTSEGYSREQSTLAHKVFYSNFDREFSDMYHNFMKEVIKKIVPYEFHYQRVPTFRVGLPGNLFIKEFHRDSDYNHQEYEVNFNLGLSNFIGDAALLAETTPDSNDYELLECPYGEIFSLNHIDCRHGANINSTDKTMVSFDFRIALKDYYYESELTSMVRNTRFAIGSYFSNNAIS